EFIKPLKRSHDTSPSTQASQFFLKQCPDKTCIEMFKDTFQSGFLSVLYSIGSKPLQIWTKQVRNGHIKRITDNDIQSLVLEIVGTNVSTTYITCPAESDKTLGIKLPFLVMIIKNLKKYFTFEVQILDDKNVRRRFRASNYQSTTRVKPFICTMPMRLDEGWNQISSTCQTSPGEPTAPTTSRLCESRSMRTAASGGCTSPTGSTPRTNCQPSSSSSCLLAARSPATSCRRQRSSRLSEPRPSPSPNALLNPPTSPPCPASQPRLPSSLIVHSRHSTVINDNCWHASI
ncbi:hypothetical protein BOX15_Mlig021881g4, partial [Macrostomum lignano]